VGTIRRVAYTPLHITSPARDIQCTAHPLQNHFSQLCLVFIMYTCIP
jgi:hypothetical protein